MSSRSIAIVGAGPAGLSIASIVSKSTTATRVDIFERDDRDRDQGAGWDLDSHARKTLERAGVNLSSISRPNSATMRFFPSQPVGNKPFATMNLPRYLQRFTTPQLETNRTAMRNALLTEIESSAGGRQNCRVVFSQPVTRVELQQSADTKRLVLFGPAAGAATFPIAEQALGEYDLVIDCSGVNSKLRRFRFDGETNLSKHYTGLSLVHGYILDPEASLPKETVQQLGEGTSGVFGPHSSGRGGFAFYMQRFGATASDRRASFGHICARPGMQDLSTELGLPLSSRFLAENNSPEKLAMVKAWLASQMDPQHWHPMYYQCINAIAAVAIRPLFKFPAVPSVSSSTCAADGNYEFKLPLICVGDALHALPPYTGSGGNFALQDAGEVADWVVRHWATSSGAGSSRSSFSVDLASLQALETQMLKRVKFIDYMELTTREYLLSASQLDAKVFQNMTLDRFIAPDGKWTVGRRTSHAVLRALLFLNSLDNYGM